MTNNEDVESAARTPDEDSPFMRPDELREHLRGKMEEYVGLRDLERANQRMAMLHEWRDDDV